MYLMMSRCWLLPAPRLTIEPISTSVWGRLSMMENRPLPISAASAIAGPLFTGSLYWASEIRPGEPVPMPSCTGPDELTKAKVKLRPEPRTTKWYHISMMPALPPKPVVRRSICPRTGVLEGTSDVPVGNIAGKLAGGAVKVAPEYRGSPMLLSGECEKDGSTGAVPEWTCLNVRMQKLGSNCVILL